MVSIVFAAGCRATVFPPRVWDWRLPEIPPSLPTRHRRQPWKCAPVVEPVGLYPEWPSYSKGLDLSLPWRAQEGLEEA
jgi:hypothetical protein